MKIKDIQLKSNVYRFALPCYFLNGIFHRNYNESACEVANIYLIKNKEHKIDGYSYEHFSKNYGLFGLEFFTNKPKQMERFLNFKQKLSELKII